MRDEGLQQSVVAWRKSYYENGSYSTQRMLCRYETITRIKTKLGSKRTLEVIYKHPFNIQTNFA